LIIRPAFTLGGTGGGIAYNREELDVIVARGLDLSPVHEVLIEESLVGWKEFEMEVMRDRMDNCVVVCSIENFDPMGVHTGDSIKNDITRETPACFEPTIDYCVVKVPRFTFEKFPQADATLTTRMKSVGEAMAIGRTFKEALQKALRSLEIKRFGLCGDGADKFVDPETLRLKLSIPNADRIFYLAQAFEDGMSTDEVYELTKIDKWFLRNVEQIVEEALALGSAGISSDRKLGFQPDSADGLPDRRFQPFDEQSEVSQKHRHLPHWEQANATYFVTFRLADSIPQDVFEQWHEERAIWLKHHPQPWDWKTA